VCAPDVCVCLCVYVCVFVCVCWLCAVNTSFFPSVPYGRTDPHVWMHRVRNGREGLYCSEFPALWLSRCPDVPPPLPRHSYPSGFAWVFVMFGLLISVSLCADVPPAPWPAYSFAVPLAIAFFILNSVAVAHNATTAMPFGTILVVVALFLLLAFPLTLLGGIAGKHATVQDPPSRVAKVRWRGAALPPQAAKPLPPTRARPRCPPLLEPLVAQEPTACARLRWRNTLPLCAVHSPACRHLPLCELFAPCYVICPSMLVGAPSNPRGTLVPEGLPAERGCRPAALLRHLH
jgi:hypothetical protein